MSRSTAQTLFAASLALALFGAWAQSAAPADSGTKPVIAAGTVPDEATKSAILTRLRELYGAERVIDQLQIDAVVAPPNWRQHVVNLLGPGLQQVSAGKLEINGNAVRVSGQVANEMQRQQIVSGLSTRLNSSYTVDGQQLRIGGGGQHLLDQTLANRNIEFESGSATLTPQGQAILDEMAAALRRLGTTRVQIIGHTDSVGQRQANFELSQARAAAVKAYLEQQGVAGGNLSMQGLGPDQPIADNASLEGRTRNRRIEFRVL